MTPNQKKNATKINNITRGISKYMTGKAMREIRDTIRSKTLSKGQQGNKRLTTLNKSIKAYIAYKEKGIAIGKRDMNNLRNINFTYVAKNAKTSSGNDIFVEKFRSIYVHSTDEYIAMLEEMEDNDTTKNLSDSAKRRLAGQILNKKAVGNAFAKFKKNMTNAYMKSKKVEND